MQIACAFKKKKQTHFKKKILTQDLMSARALGME